MDAGRTMAGMTRAVVVAGGGPSGLAAAAELALHGIDCVVIEPRIDISHTRPRAKTTNVRTMEHLRRWGAAEALRAAAPLPVAWSQRVTFCHSLAGPRVTDFDGAFGLTVGRDDRFAEAGQQVPQPVIEQVLRDHVDKQPSVELRLGHRVTGLRRRANAVTVYAVDDTGSPYELEARYLLGCDGAWSVVRERIGVQYTGRSDSRPNFNVVFRAPTLDTSLGPAVQYWAVGGKHPGVIGRLDLAGTWWAIFPGVDPAYGEGHAAELIADIVGGPVEHELLASDPWTARMLVAERFRDGRVFLVGESAHLNPPWGGHGYNTCVGDAVNIAWKIAAVEQGWAGSDLLASYEPERRAVVEQTVATAESNMRHLAGDLAADPDAIQEAKRAEFHSLGLVLGYTYAGSPVIQQTAGEVKAGDVSTYLPSDQPGSRLPHAWLADGSSLYDRLGKGFTLIGPRHSEDLAERARRLGMPLQVLQQEREDFLLVRPDQHIAWRADDPAEIDLALTIGRTDR
ncbi:FAD-dependent monooxygenase [Nonomuraea sp. NPDC050328]|uniref:FAD-dependent monooxygenase n=1 Tax=Nonomuraea sp. NPDC050328 TaxID=3364361 RepID=UPI00379A29BE